MARRADAGPSLFAHGGGRGDELALRIVSGAPSRLAPGGRAAILADWPLIDGDPLDRRVHDALGGASAEALVLQSPAKNLDEYCTALAAAEHPHLDDAFARAACAQRDHFERLGVRGVAQALVVLEASGAGGATLVSVRHGHDAPVTSESVDCIIAAHRLASGPDGPLLDARLRLPTGTRLVEQPGAHAVIVQLPPARPEWPFAVEPDAALALQEIHDAPSVLEAARRRAERTGALIEAVAPRVGYCARWAPPGRPRARRSAGCPVTDRDTLRSR